MTVGELKKALSAYADDMEVMTQKTTIFGNVGYVHRVKTDVYAFFGKSIPCVLLTDDFPEDCPCDDCNFTNKCMYESNCPREAIWKAEHEVVE